MWGFALWALSHIVARGDAAAAIFRHVRRSAVSGTWLIDRLQSAARRYWRRFAAGHVECAVRGNRAGTTGFASRNRLVKIALGFHHVFFKSPLRRARASCEPGAAPAPRSAAKIAPLLSR